MYKKVKNLFSVLSAAAIMCSTVFVSASEEMIKIPLADTIDFESDEFSSFFRSDGDTAEKSVALSNGVQLKFSKDTKGVFGVTRSDEGGFVTGDETDNRYLLVRVPANDTTANKLSVILPEGIKDDYVLEFKYAFMTTRTEGYIYTNHTPLVLGSLFDGDIHTTRMTRLMTVYGKGQYGVGKITAESPPGFNGWYNHSVGSPYKYYNGNETTEDSETAGTVGEYPFETVRIITEFHSSDVPSYTVYRKKAGEEKFTLLSENLKDFSYSSVSSEGKPITPETYAATGINIFGFTMKGMYGLRETE